MFGVNDFFKWIDDIFLESKCSIDHFPLLFLKNQNFWNVYQNTIFLFVAVPPKKKKKKNKLNILINY